jgi:hypothetical protein
VATGLAGQGLPRALIVKGREMRFDLLIALGNLLVIEGLEGHGLL